MNPTILRTNATAVYRFLSIIHSRLPEGESLRGRRILDCGAGGRVPPLVIFAEQGMDCVGIDISAEALSVARAFSERAGHTIDLKSADMRELPFPDASFDYVYEHFSMCHLSKADTATAIGEMRRVLKPGGISFFGVISSQSWPLSEYGEEHEPGEFWMIEGSGMARHSLFTDEEAARLLEGWDVVLKERIAFHRGGEELSEDAWEGLREEWPVPFTASDWKAEYGRRTDFFRYVHAYFVVRKRH